VKKKTTTAKKKKNNKPSSCSKALPALQALWSAKSERHAKSISTPISNLKEEAHFHLQALWLRSLHDESALLALANLVVDFSEGVSTVLLKKGHEVAAGKFEAFARSMLGESAELKNGLASDFCSKWLFLAGWNLAGGTDAPRSFLMPQAATAVKKAVEHLQENYGDDWQDHADLALVFKPLRRDWTAMEKWEKRDLVRQTLKSAARTYNRQAVRAKNHSD